MFAQERVFPVSEMVLEIAQPSITLNNGREMPMLGIGTCHRSCSQPNEVEEALEYAIDIGYRHIDTAFAYGTEKDVGRAVRKKIHEGVIQREDIFIVTKLWSTYHKPERVLEGVRKSLENLQMEYVDLFLIHNPAGLKLIDQNNLFSKSENGQVQLERTDHALIWKELEKAVDQGLSRSIGLSNFNKRQIQHILSHARIKPANLQVECHAYFMQKPLFQFCRENGMTFTAYAPLGSPRRAIVNPNDPILLEENALKDIAERHGKTPAQILNRYLIDCGRITIPKSINKERIKENFEILNFKLTDTDLQQMDALDKNLRYFVFDFIKDSEDFPFADDY